LAIDPHAELILVLVSAAAFLMMKAGLGKNMLEPRRRPTRCPSCGRHGCNCA
jgi:hypothetical protein